MNSTSLTMIVFRCEKCNQAYRDKATADKCCQPYHCEDCGKETPQYRMVCDTCATMRRYWKAEKLIEWDGWICCEGIGHNDGYFENVDALIDYCEDEDIPIPEWVYICSATKHELNIDNALENMTEEAYEGAMDHLKDVKELREFVKLWNEKQTIVSYESDWKKVLLIKRHGQEVTANG